MKDVSRFNYKDYPIYLIVVFHYEEEQIQFFQKIPVANFDWMRAQVSTHVKHLLKTTRKQGKSLYNDLTDYYFTREIKVTSLKFNKSALVVFYNSCIDFYQIGPIVLNLRKCIQILGETNKMDWNRLKKIYVDINTLISDCLSCVNCFNRVLIKGLEAFSGREAIYNQTCFMHLINKSGLAELVRDHAGRLSYSRLINTKTHSKRLIDREKKDTPLSGLTFKVDSSMLKCYQSINSERYQKFNQKIAAPQLKIIKETAVVSLTDREDSSRNAYLKGKSAFIVNDKQKKFMTTSYIALGNKSDTNVTASTLALVDLDFDTLKQKGIMANSVISSSTSQIVPSNSSAPCNYPDISRINDRIEQMKSVKPKSEVSVQPNDNYKKYQKEEKKGIIDDLDFDFQTIAKINQSVIQMTNKPSMDMSSQSKPNTSSVVYPKSNNINPLSQNTVPIYNLVQSSNNANSSLQHSTNTLWYDKKFQSQVIQSPVNRSVAMNNQFSLYTSSLPNKNAQVSLNITSDNDISIQRFSTQKPPLNLQTSYTNPLNTLSLDYPSNVMHTSGNSGNLSSNKLGMFNSVGGSSPISPNVPMNRVNQRMQQQGMTLSNQRLSSSSLPPDNNRYNSTNFSEDDMSFLSNNSNKNKEYDDTIILNKTNPNLVGELKEKYFYYFQKGTLINSDGKGYIGLSLRNGFHLNKKVFSLMILQAKWKDQQFFSRKEFDHSTLTKLTEVDYRLECKNVSNDLKVITYFPNPLRIENLVAIRVRNDYNPMNHQVQFEINFSFNQHYIGNVYRMTFSMFLRRTLAKIIQQSHQPVQINELEYKINFNTVAKLISFTIESPIPNPIEKIQFCFEMKVSIEFIAILIGLHSFSE